MHVCVFDNTQHIKLLCAKRKIINVSVQVVCGYCNYLSCTSRGVLSSSHIISSQPCSSHLTAIVRSDRPVIVGSVLDMYANVLISLPFAGSVSIVTSLCIFHVVVGYHRKAIATTFDIAVSMARGRLIMLCINMCRLW